MRAHAAKALPLILAVPVLAGCGSGGSAAVLAPPTPTAGQEFPLSWRLMKVDGTTLTIAVDYGTCDHDLRISTTEDAEHVEIDAVGQNTPNPADGCLGVGKTDQRSVVLKAPLGSRALVGCQPQDGHDCATIG